jgi:hypothetical protein
VTCKNFAGLSKLSTRPASRKVSVRTDKLKRKMFAANSEERGTGQKNMVFNETFAAQATPALEYGDAGTNDASGVAIDNALDVAADKRVSVAERRWTARPFGWSRHLAKHYGRQHSSGRHRDATNYQLDARSLAGVAHHV